MLVHYILCNVLRGKKWLCNLDWDPKGWVWRQIDILVEITILNYTTRRGYMVALKQNNNAMGIDGELEASWLILQQSSNKFLQ